MSNDVGVMFSLVNGWTASETTSAARDLELLPALNKTSMHGDSLQSVEKVLAMISLVYL